MKILALDSTAQVCSVAVTEDETPLFVSVLNNGNTHSETLLPAIESALKLLGLTVGDIDLFACTTGPGSFTGVRIGASVIKGLAFGRKKPCVSVSTPEALAQNLLSLPGILCPVMNARRDQLYNALFESDGEVLRRLCPDRAIAAEDLMKELAAWQKPIYFCGDGYGIAQKAAADLPGVAETPALLIPQNAASVARVALREFREGRAVSDAALVPIYLRPCQAERERLEREGKTSQQ